MSIAGRRCRIKYHATGLANPGVVVAAAKTDGMTGTAEPIDATTKDSAGVRQFLDDVGMKSWQMDWEGNLAAAPQHRTLIELFQESGKTGEPSLHAFSFECPGVGVWSGLMFIATLQTGAEDGPAATSFSMTLQSSGELAFVPAS